MTVSHAVFLMIMILDTIQKKLTLQLLEIHDY